MVMGKLAETELTPEEVSSFIDGELDAERSARIGGALRESVPLATWERYHVIGDLLRGCGDLSPGFHERFAAAFSVEPTVLAPPRMRPSPAAVAWALAASVAAVGVVSWVALTTMPVPPATTVATAPQAAAVRADVHHPVVNEYLLAHQEYSPT